MHYKYTCIWIQLISTIGILPVGSLPRNAGEKFIEVLQLYRCLLYVKAVLEQNKKK